MQIESLKMFCDVVETKSFTKAAEINRVTQSAVSQAVSNLEKAFLKIKLLDRSTKEYRPTSEGKILYDCSKRIIEEYEAILDKMQQDKNVSAGRIRISTDYSIGLHELPPYTKRFLKDNPGVNVQIKHRHVDLVYADVLGSKADLGLVAYPAPDSQLEIVPLQNDSLVLICHPQHRFAKLMTMTPGALSGQKLIGFDPAVPTRKALDIIFKDHGVDAEHVMEFDNIETLKRAVEDDSGVAIVPEKAIRREVEAETLVSVVLEGGDWVRQRGLIYRKGKVLSQAMHKLIELLKKPI
jgi:LysR family transcriptional regulator, transcriptional activator of the cysJI operon